MYTCRARQHAKNVSWLRRTEYISTEYARPHGSGDGAETKYDIFFCNVSGQCHKFIVIFECFIFRVGYSVKKKLQGMDVYKVKMRVNFFCLMFNVCTHTHTHTGQSKPNCCNRSYF